MSKVEGLFESLFEKVLIYLGLDKHRLEHYPVLLRISSVRRNGGLNRDSEVSSATPVARAMSKICNFLRKRGRRKSWVTWASDHGLTARGPHACESL
ncbi:hypothetical protein EVAR_76495_1 [Eumeta japonica]|uniref:Uncharacterized protein n=1 Tax=Eumeta variegata TaxID=151549 RepID=A0A4C1T5J2_EUMVA|nr:hypothetical protein EVAR_76495_1 [Eumeta japonica]